MENNKDGVFIGTKDIKEPVVLKKIDYLSPANKLIMGKPGPGKMCRAKDPRLNNIHLSYLEKTNY